MSCHRIHITEELEEKYPDASALIKSNTHGKEALIALTLQKCMKPFLDLGFTLPTNLIELNIYLNLVNNATFIPQGQAINKESIPVSDMIQTKPEKLAATPIKRKKKEPIDIPVNEEIVMPRRNSTDLIVFDDISLMDEFN